MALRVWLVLPITLVLMCSTARVSADPITAVYHVQVTDRMTSLSNPIWEPFAAEFVLRMSFDPANAGDRTYGPVSFSPVPLPVVPLPAPGALARTSFTAHGMFEENPFGANNLFASAAVDEVGTFPFSTYFKTLRLISNVPPGDPPPVINAETFPAHLVLGEHNFDFGSRLVGPDSQTLQFRGFATLQEVQPVPEPGTLGLLGAGLLVAANHRRRRRNARAS